MRSSKHLLKWNRATEAVHVHATVLSNRTGHPFESARGERATVAFGTVRVIQAGAAPIDFVRGHDQETDRWPPRSTFAPVATESSTQLHRDSLVALIGPPRKNHRRRQFEESQHHVG